MDVAWFVPHTGPHFAIDGPSLCGKNFALYFTIPELRQKILLTLGFLAIYRIGWHITLPVIDQEMLSQSTSGRRGLWRLHE